MAIIKQDYGMLVGGGLDLSNIQTEAISNGQTKTINVKNQIVYWLKYTHDSGTTWNIYDLGYVVNGVFTRLGRGTDQYYYSNYSNGVLTVTLHDSGEFYLEYCTE